MSLEHVCFSQHLNERKPLKCNCRKRITLQEATKQVEKGFAQWIILSEKLVTTPEVCPICHNDPIAKTICTVCLKTGSIEKVNRLITHGEDIVLVTAGGQDAENDAVYRSVKAKQTPRVATIERTHIERAYVGGDLEEQERIELYGLSILEERIRMGIGVEPDDDLKNCQGRKHDTGRSPFARISDERTVGGVGKRIVEGFKIMNPYEADEDYR